MWIENKEKTRMMYGGLHSKSNVDRLYVKRKEGGRGLIVWNNASEKKKTV